MISPETRRVLRIAIQIDEITDEACRQAFRWKMHKTRGFDFVPPLFVMGGVELPIVPRIAPPRIESRARKDRP
jgi:hypothetical protein